MDDADAKATTAALLGEPSRAATLRLLYDAGLLSMPRDRFEAALAEARRLDREYRDYLLGVSPDPRD